METAYLMEGRPQCIAISKQSGERCKRRPHPGSTVCVIHGAAAKQVRDSARLRLLEAADKATATLVGSLSSDNESNAIKAAQLILDRAGLGPMSSVELSGPDGGPVETTDTSWIDYCTPGEKLTVMSIAEKAMERAKSRLDSKTSEVVGDDVISLEESN